MRWISQLLMDSLSALAAGSDKSSWGLVRPKSQLGWSRLVLREETRRGALRLLPRSR